MLNLGTRCRLKRVIQFLFKGVNELSHVVRVGDEHIDALFVSCFDILGEVLMHLGAESLRPYGSRLVCSVKALLDESSHAL